MNFPVFSQLAGNLAFRDEFARDCLLQRGVMQTIGSSACGAVVELPIPRTRRIMR